MADVLLTVSGEIDSDRATSAAAGRLPQADYFALADRFRADLLDYTQARRMTGVRGRSLERMGGPDLMLAWACFQLQKRYRVIFTDGEQIGLPLAALWRMFGREGVQHFMIAHVLSVPKKQGLLDHLHLYRQIDRFFVYSTWQKHFIETRWPVAPQRVVFTPFMVDADFFAPARVTAQPRRMICAVGLERRDYATLMQAVDGLDVEVVIAAASPWSKQANSTQDAALPENVTVKKFSQFDLRQLYADALFTVMPLESVNFQAGVTALLEAMAMERAVICTRTPGQTDVVVEGATGLYVPAYDAAALRSAIERLLAAPHEAASMGRAGRQRVLQAMSLACYTERLAAYVDSELGQPEPQL